MIDLSTLPPLFHQVLEALQLPDPAPRHVVDSVKEAVERRLPGVSASEIEVALRELRALGFVRLPYLDAVVSPRVTENPREWITEEGWAALGRSRPN